MASSSAGQPRQQRRRRTPPTFEASASTANGAQPDTFASYLEQRSANPQHIPPVVARLKPLKPSRCAHCNRKRLEEEEDLSSIVSAPPTPNPNNGGEHTVSWSDADAAPREHALEGRSCSGCAVEIYGRTRRHLRDGSPPPAGGGGNTPLHQATRSGNLRMLFHLVTLLGLDAGHGRMAEALRRTNERHVGDTMVWSLKVCEDKTPRALKPTPGVSAEVDSLRYSSRRNAKTGEDRATPASRVVRRPRGLRLSG